MTSELSDSAGGLNAEEAAVADDRPDVPFTDQASAEAQMGAVKKTDKAKGGVLGAAMMALGQIIEPDKVKETIEVTAEADAPDDDPLAGLNFGNLPPID